MRIQSLVKPSGLKMMALGDSMSAGMQDCTLSRQTQQGSMPRMVADQLSLDFRQPEFDERGAPPVVFGEGRVDLAQVALRYSQVGLAAAVPLGLLQAGFLPHENLLKPLDWATVIGHVDQPPPYDNVAISGFELRHLNDTRNVYDLMGEMLDGAESPEGLSFFEPYVKGVLQHGQTAAAGRSQIDQAVANQPDLITFFAGVNDFWEATSSGCLNDATLTPMEDKLWELGGGKTTAHPKKGLRSALVGPEGAITRLLNETDAHILEMTVPDVTAFPQLREVGKPIGKLPFRVILKGRDLTEQIEQWVIPDQIRGQGTGGRAHFPPGSKVSLATIATGLAHWKDPHGVFTEDQVLDPEEAATIRHHIAEYNQLLHQTAEANDRVHLVDLSGWFERVKTGLELEGEGPSQTVGPGFTGVTDEQGRQGIFSYDGLHFSQAGNALVANQVLQAARQLAAWPGLEELGQAPPVDEKRALAEDPRLRPADS